MEELLIRLRDKIEDAELEANASDAVSPDSYTAGYDMGYADALKELWRELTGNDFQ